MLELNILPPKIAIHLASTGRSVEEVVASNHVPKLNNWSRIEITYEEEGGKYFLSFSLYWTLKAFCFATGPKL